MNNSSTFTRTALLLPLLPLWATAAVASDTSDEEAVTLPSRPSSHGPESRVEPIRPIFDNAEFCTVSVSQATDTAGIQDCPFVNRSVGIALTSRQASENAELELSATFQRESNGAFASYRQLNPLTAGLNKEATLAAIGIKGALFDDRLKFQSMFAWSRGWEAPIVGEILPPREMNQSGGAVQSHRLDIKLADRPQLRWTLTGEIGKGSGDFRLGRMASTAQVNPVFGTRRRISTRLGMKDLQLRASYLSRDSRFSAAEAVNIAADFRGASIRVARQRGQSKANDVFLIRPRMSTRTTYGVDIDLYSLSPRLALDESWPASLLPKSFGISVSQEQFGRQGSSTLTHSESIDLFGLWQTAIGTTTMGVHLRDSDTSLVPSEDAWTRTFYLTHSFELGDWDFGFELTRISDASMAASQTSNRIASLGFSAAYSSPGGPKFRLSIGQDQARLVSEDVFAFRDTASYLDARLDLTPFLLSQFKGQDMALTVEYRARLTRNRFELAWSNDPAFVDVDRQLRDGLLINFVRRF